MKKCDGINCTRRTPEKIPYCCDECEQANKGEGEAPFRYAHSAECDASEVAAHNGVAMPRRPSGITETKIG